MQFCLCLDRREWGSATPVTLVSVAKLDKRAVPTVTAKKDARQMQSFAGSSPAAYVEIETVLRAIRC